MSKPLKTFNWLAIAVFAAQIVLWMMGVPVPMIQLPDAPPTIELPAAPPSSPTIPQLPADANHISAAFRVHPSPLQRASIVPGHPWPRTLDAIAYAVDYTP